MTITGESYAKRAMRYLETRKGAVTAKELAEHLGVHYLKAAEVLKDIGWQRQLVYSPKHMIQYVRGGAVQR